MTTTTQAPLTRPPARRGAPWAHRPDPGASSLRDRLEQALDEPAPLTGTVDLSQLGGVPTQGRVLGQGGKGRAPAGQGGKGDLFGAEGHGSAQLALRQVKPPAVGNAYAQHKAEVRQDLERLGLLTPGTARIHIDDVNPEHGAAVTRTAVGPTSLAQGADTTLNVDGVPADFAAGRRTQAQAARLSELDARRAQAKQGELTSDAMATLVADELEGTILDHGDAVAFVRGQLPKDGKNTLMNMSWGQSPERLLTRSVGQMMVAPEGSAAFKEVSELLGHPPTRTALPTGGTQLDPEEFKAVRAHLEPKVDALLTSDAHRARMQAGRDALAHEVAAGRAQGLLVFSAAGNEQAGAARHGRPDLAVSTLSGVPGVVMVGATDLGAPGTADDAVAPFSNGGKVTLSAAGVGLPVGAPRGPLGGLVAPAEPIDEDGTSLASPVVVEAAYLVDAVRPGSSADQIASLLTDPRAVYDIPGTDLDGAGQVDHFAVALLARNPALTRGQIDAARATLRSSPSDAQVAALRHQLGLD